MSAGGLDRLKAHAFSNLLAYTIEQGATGIDEAAEVRCVLAARPPITAWNPGILAALKAALGGHRAIYSVPRPIIALWSICIATCPRAKYRLQLERRCRRDDRAD